MIGIRAAIVAACAALAACEPPTPGGGPQGPTPAPVARPLVRDVQEWDEYTGRFEAVRSVEIRARVSGYLDSIHFDDGAIVEADDLLFVIDPRPFEAALAQARAEIGRARAQLNLAELQLQRVENLRNSPAFSAEQLDERTEQRNEAAAALASAEASARQAELNLEFTEVRAPIHGRISNHFVNVGNLVTGGAESATLLTRIVSLHPIHFVFDASEADYLKYVRLAGRGERPSSRDASNPVEVKLADEDGFDHKGQMNFVDNRIDPSTGTIVGRAILDNPDFVLLPGMFGRLRLLAGPVKPTLLIPDAAVGTDQSEKFVWRLDDANVASRAYVELGPIIDGLRVVRSGLSPDSRLVVGALHRVRPGAEIAPEERSLDAAEG